MITLTFIFLLAFMATLGCMTAVGILHWAQSSVFRQRIAELLAKDFIVDVEANTNIIDVKWQSGHAHIHVKPSSVHISNYGGPTLAYQALTQDVVIEGLYKGLDSIGVPRRKAL